MKIGFAKIGNIALSPIVEHLLDERAEREDIDVRVVSSGAKLGVDQAIEVTQKTIEFNPNFVIAVSANASLPGPSKIREMLKEVNIPTLVISDNPAKKAKDKIAELGQGYIIVEADSMIGARREFLDPVEMALFNADLIKVLAITGVFNILYSEIDRVINSLKNGEAPEMPKIIINKEKAADAANFQNPYAKSKAMAAYEIARRVADLSTEGCFVVKEWERYTQIVAAAHEMLRTASHLAEEARELEKSNDSVFRAPHYDDGTILEKRKLIEKPKKS
jgi:methylenetetrahydromethanopterin dehydrogenase